MFFSGVAFLAFAITFGNCCRTSSFNNIQTAMEVIQSELDQVKCCCNNPNPDPCNVDLIAYYQFDRSYRDVCHGNNGLKEGTVELHSDSGVKNGAAFFNGKGLVRVVRLNDYNWGSEFSVSLWFKRTGQSGNYQGLVNNGYHSSGSWEIRMGREMVGQMIGGGVVTQNSPKTWDYAHLKATYNHWHHVAMTYNGTNLDFYIDNQKQAGNANCCQGDIVTKPTDVVIGQAGKGMVAQYFYGYIDEVKLYKKALSAEEVQDLYQLKNV